MELENFLSNDAFTMVNKKLAKAIGLGQAVFIQELISQRKRFKQPEFYFTENNINEDLGVTPKTQQRYIKELKELGLINVTKKGIPARNFFTINDEKVLAVISNGKTCSDKMSELDETKCPDYSYIKKDTKKDLLDIPPSSDSNESSSGDNNNSLNSKSPSTCDYIAQFDIFRKIYPHARQGKKQEAKKYFMKQDVAEVMENVKLKKWKIELGIEDTKFVPACQRWIRDFVPLSDVVKEQDLYKIICRHMQMDNKKERYAKLKDDFGAEKMDELVRKYNSSNKPVLHFN